MSLTVREMTLAETDLIIEYFHSSTPEHLETLGVDPTRLPNRESWRERLKQAYARPIEQRAEFSVIWLSDNRPVGFSSSDKIAYGEQANMHLHVIDPEQRRQGIGVECVRYLFRTIQAEAALLRAECFQCGAQPRNAESGFQIRQDAHDRTRSAQFSSSRNPLGDGALIFA
jgi:ribosomal protein S18 acetylase RimI-like enzyme